MNKQELDSILEKIKERVNRYKKQLKKILYIVQNWMKTKKNIHKNKLQLDMECEKVLKIFQIIFIMYLIHRKR